MGEHGDPDPEEDDRKRAEPAEPPDAIVLTGYVEPGGRSGYLRLYLDATLRSYIELLESDVRHREDATGGESSVGPKTTLWIRRGALLEYTTGKS